MTLFDRESTEGKQRHLLRGRAGRRRLVGVVVSVVAVVVAVVLGTSLPGSPVELGSASSGSSKDGNSKAETDNRMVIAWNPSHQDDTGTDGWHEYAVCGDITKRAMALLPGFANVLCWETKMGLTSDSGAALQSELDEANAAGADIFVAVHVNGDAPSGVSGAYCKDDSISAGYAEALLKSVASSMHMPVLYVRPRSNLLVLNPAKNDTPVRVLLELGDNVADRALLDSKEGRQMLAEALAKAVRENTPPAP